MNESHDFDRIFQEAMRDPERARRIDEYRAEIQEDRRRYREMSILQIVRDIAHAGTLPSDERDSVLNETLDFILDDPELTQDLLETFDELVDGDVVQVQQALLAAADPLTGELPPDFALPDELKDALEHDPGVREFKEHLPHLIRGDSDERINRVTRSMQGFLAPWYQRRQISSDWLQREFDPAEGADLVLVNRSLVLDQDLDVVGDFLPEPGDVQTLFADDSEGYLRLGESRIYRDDGLFDVRLRLYLAGGEDLLVTGRDEWRVEVNLNAKVLEVVLDDQFEDAWRLAQPVSAEDLKQISYEVELVQPE